MSSDGVQQEEYPASFVCSTRTSLLSNAIEIIKWKNDQDVNLLFTCEWIKIVTLDDTKIFQGTVTLKREFFEEFGLASPFEPFNITISLRRFVDCLKICSSASANASISLYSPVEKKEVRLAMRDGIVTIDCTLRATEVEETECIDFSTFTTVASVQIPTEKLSSSLTDLGFTDGRYVDLIINPNEGVSLHMDTDHATVEAKIPQHLFEVYNVPQLERHQYPQDKLLHALLPPTLFLSRPLKTLLSVSEQGVLSVLHSLYPSQNTDRVVFVEFVLLPSLPVSSFDDIPTDAEETTPSTSRPGEESEAQETQHMSIDGESMIRQFMESATRQPSISSSSSSSSTSSSLQSSQLRHSESPAFSDVQDHSTPHRRLRPAVVSFDDDEDEERDQADQEDDDEGYDREDVDAELMRRQQQRIAQQRQANPEGGEVEEEDAEEVDDADFDDLPAPTTSSSSSGAHSAVHVPPFSFGSISDIGPSQKFD